MARSERGRNKVNWSGCYIAPNGSHTSFTIAKGDAQITVSRLGARLLIEELGRAIDKPFQPMLKFSVNDVEDLIGCFRRGYQ